MNEPPDTCIHVPYEPLRRFVAKAGSAAGLPVDKANILADMLAGNDLRGNFSHGTQQIATYARLMKGGKLNSSPHIRVVRETGGSAIVDGDGGLGYFPSRRATELLIDKALKNGLAVTQTRNHGHFGAAGLYARMTLGHDLLTFVTSGHQLDLRPNEPIYRAAGGSPMAFSVPCGEEPPLVLDFGAMHDLYAGDPHRDELARLAPGLVLRSIGLGEICQVWGGLLSGLSMHAEARPWAYAGANQGALFFCFRVDLFLPPEKLKAEMAEYVRRVRKLKALQGFNACYLPGGIEAERERRYRRDGIPVGEAHQKCLEDLARELDLEIPWQGA